MQLYCYTTCSSLLQTFFMYHSFLLASMELVHILGSLPSFHRVSDTTIYIDCS
ncbi:hypothetical protein BJX70DRAFT_369103 [Aspergillus crustosus]